MDGLGTLGRERRGSAGWEGHGPARIGAARIGRARQRWSGWHGLARRAPAGLGAHRSGLDRTGHGSIGKDRPGAAREVEWPGRA